MKTISVNIYEFNELTDKAKQKAIIDHKEALSGDSWDDWAHDDAKEVGLLITDHDVGRGDSCRLDVITTHEDVAHKILETHGEKCETYEPAKTYVEDYARLNSGKTVNTKESFHNAWQHIKDDFYNALCRAYLAILRREHEHAGSDDYATQSIEANEYEFYEDGSFYKELTKVTLHTNKDRAELVKNILENQMDGEEYACDLICNIKHFCNEYGYDFNEHMERAENHYQSELE